MPVLAVDGVMTGYICSAVTDFVVAFAEDFNIVNLHNWFLSSFSGLYWDNVAVMAAVTGPALALSFLLSKPIGAYQLREVYAQNTGVSLRTFRAALTGGAMGAFFCTDGLAAGYNKKALIEKSGFTPGGERF